MRRANLVVGMAAVLFGLAFLLHVRTLPEEAAIFPRVLLLLLIGLGLALTGFNLRRRREGLPLFLGLRLGRMLAVAMATVGYIALIPVVGFFVLTFLFLVLVPWALAGRKWSARALGGPAVFAAVFSGFLYLLFELFLNVPLPRGWLF